MTQVQFYNLPTGFGSLLPVLVELMETAIASNLDVLILTGSETQAAPLHHYLEQRFRLGGELGISPSPSCRYSLSWEDSPGPHHGLLVNLKPELPHWFSRFEILAEIIWGDDNLVKQKRENYRLVRHRGYPLRFLDLTGAPQTSLL